MGTLAPEVKRLTLSQRLNGKKGHQNTSLTGFLLFFVTCHAARNVTQCHAIFIFLIRGDSHMKVAGMLVGNFEWNPLRRPTSVLANPFLPPKDTILFQCSLGIDVYTENFDYMNWVKISIIVLKYLSLHWFSVSFQLYSLLNWSCFSLRLKWKLFFRGDV